MSRSVCFAEHPLAFLRTPRLTLKHHARFPTERNASLQPRLEALRRETQAYFDTARALDGEWGPLQLSLAEMYKRFSPGSLHSALTQGTHRIDEASEALANAYVEGMPSLASGVLTPENNDGGAGTPTQAPAPAAAAGGRAQDPDTHFVRKFRDLRTRYHRRALLAERWSKGTVDWRDE